MKKLALAVAMLALGGTAASAADLGGRPYTKAPAVPVYNWTGFYVGLNAGGAWNESNLTTSAVAGDYFADSSIPAIAAAGNQNINRSGFTGGLTTGYNWQANNWLAGIEADFNYFGIRGSTSATAIYPCCAPIDFTVNSSVSSDWLITLRGRLGVLVSPSLLLYGTGGLALANVKSNYLFTSPYDTTNESASIDTTRYGWTAGVGAEYALLNGWSVKAEYLYVDLGRTSTRSTNMTADGFAYPTSVFTHTVDLRSNIGRVGLNYKF